jgi:hypothetical protein
MYITFQVISELVHSQAKVDIYIHGHKTLVCKGLGHMRISPFTSIILFTIFVPVVV